MKNSKGFVYFLIFSLIAGLVSCDTGSNDNNNIALFVVASQKIQEAQKASALKKSMVRMSGKISMPEGAVPSEFIEVANAAGKNSTRGTGIDVSNLNGYTYFIETKNSAGETFDPDYDFDNTDGTFTITLLPGTWKLKAGIINDEGTTVYISDEITQTVTAEDSVFNKTFVLHPLQKSDGEGHFKITMTVSENVKKVVMKFVSGDSGKWEAAGLDTEVPLTISGTTVSLPGTTVTMASGSYTVRFLFYDSTAEHPTLLFSSYQTINIYDGLTSDKWNASASIGDADSVIDSSGNFVVTNSLVNSYMISNIYVASAANGGNDDNAGSYYGPVATLNKAFRSIASYGNASGEYTINIKGELSGNFEVPDSINSKAQKITICGANEPVNGVPVDTLNGNRQGTVLTVSSTVPVVIQNLKITGGYVNGDGGGIKMAEGTNVTLEEGALVGEISDEPADSDNSKNGNRSEGCGAGIYNYGGTLTLERGSRVSYNYAGEGDDDLWGSKQGGGIYCSKGTITIKEGACVSYNGADSRGGGIFLENVEGSVKTKLIMEGGEISNNKVLLFGGGVFMGGDGSNATGNVEFKMSGGKISKNESTSLRVDMGQGGAAIWMDGGAFEMSGNSEISENVSYKLAGGIKINEKYCKVELKGGTIKNNIATSEFIINPNTNPPTTTHSGDGGAIHNGGTLIISGPVSIPTGGEVPSKYMNDSHPDHDYWEKVNLLCKNDVYMALKGDTYYPIQITSAFSTTGNEKIPVSLGGWKRKKAFLKGVDGSGISDVTTYSNYFEFTKSGMNISVPETDKSQARMTAPYYVAPDGDHEDETAGTESDPFDTIATAISRFTDGDKETVYVKGTVSAATVIDTEFTTTKCSSLIIEGASDLDSDGNPQDVLTIPNGENKTVLQIDTQVPITLKKIKITGGKGYYSSNSANTSGGGIFFEKGSLTLADDVLITGNSATISGGGIYVAGRYANLFMCGSSYIGDKRSTTATGTTADTAGNTCANFAGNSGGGIFNCGNVYLGYSGKDSNGNLVSADWTGGICGNAATQGGGIVSGRDTAQQPYVAGLVKMRTGKISYNLAYEGINPGYGGGISAYDGTAVEILGGEIANNQGKNGGGIHCRDSNSKVSLSGGKILQNSATEKGGAIDYSAGTIEVSGSVYIPCTVEKQNDVYLAENKFLTIAGNLTLPADAPSNAKNMVITPLAWTRGNQVLGASGTNAATLIANNASRFATIDEDFIINQKSGEMTKGVLAAPIYVASDDDNDSTRYGNKGSSSEGRGTRAKPYSSLSTALSEVDASNYTIYIDGTLKGKVEIKEDGSSPINSNILTLRGYIPDGQTVVKAALDGNFSSMGDGNTTLVINAEKTVNIYDLKITGGNATDGGGINISKGTVKLTDGATITGNTATNGGGVYVGSDGTLFMSGKALIGDSATSTTRASSSGASYYANKATNGAGIYNNGGAVYIGCDTSGQAASGYTLVNNATDGYYGVRRNYSVSDGAGIYHAAGTLKIASGDISYNFANTSGTSCGGAALLAAGATVSGGTFTGNKAANGGAFYIKSGKELTINGAASITSNEAILTGGAISNDGILTMSAGTIGSADGLNSVTSNFGGAIYQNGKFTIGGSAVVYAGTGVGEKINDVYLRSTYVTVGTLSSTSEAVAAITPETWKRGTSILSSTSVLSDEVKACFHLSKDNLGWERKDKSGSGTDTNKYVYITSPIYVVGASGTNSTKPTGFEYGKTTGANGTKTSPYASIADALTATDLANATEPNTITVAGTLVGAQQEVSSPSVDITIKGYKATGATKSDAKIQRWSSKKTTSQDAGSVLIVNASGKTVTITDLTLSYGASSNGGGIYITNGTVKLGDYAKISENYAGNKGGGVYVSSGATLFMYGKALIGDKLSTDTGITTATGQNYGNAAPYQGGGGIYNEGSVYIGYNGFKADGTTLQESAIDAGYGIIRCYTMNQDGGAIYNNGTLKIKSGSISYNRTANSGGAVVCVADATISGGTFESNYAGVSGGAVSIKASKTLTINGDAIFKNNQAESSGGAISNLGTLTMTAGTIGESGALNRIVEGKTGSGGAISQNGTFNISGSAQVYSGTGVGEKQNDVYLASGKTVTAGVFETGGNSSSIPMVITPYSWTRGSTAVTAATGVTLDATKLKCFKMSDEDWSVVLHASAGKIDAPVYVASDTSLDGFMVCTGLGSDTDGTGSRAKPYATIAKALSKAWDTSTTKTIPLVIKIDGEVKGAQTISGTINAQRVIVSGASSSYYTKPSVLNGSFDSGSPGTTLTVTTSTPVFLNRITIKGGYNTSGNGGGLSVSGSASIVDMQYAWIEGNYAMNGGGVYVASGCSFYFEDYGCIGSSDANLTVNQIDATTGLTRGVNKAYAYGAGVYNQGTFYMGYTYNITNGTAEDVSWDGDLNPLVTKNYCYNNGGGVCTVGSMKMSAGEVSKNKSAGDGCGIFVATTGTDCMTLCGGTISSNSGGGLGGGMYVKGEASVIVESGVYGEGNIISGNTAKSGGGVYVAANGSFEIKNDSPMYVYGNIASDGSSSTKGGGGVYVANNGIFEMRYGWIGRDENGTTNPNAKTRDGKGNGVYIGGSGSQFNMSYGAHVDVSNDVYVPSGAFIGVRWNTTGFPADPPPAIITPATYSPSWVIVKDVDEDQFTWSISNFKVTPNGTQNYKIQAGGSNTGYFVPDN